MFRKVAYLMLVLAAFALLLAGCGGAASSAQDAPPAVTAAPTQAVPATSAQTSVPATPAPSANTAPAATIAPSGNDSTSGSSDTVRILLVADKSSANYRVREQLAGNDLPNDAVGKTSAVSGQIVGKTDGTIDSSQSKFVVDVTKLQSDQSMRDGMVQRAILQTSQYPTVTFVPKSTEGLTMPPPTSGTVSFKLTGDLTVRNVTKPVTWDLTCNPQGDTGTCTGKTTFTFEYMGLTKPNVARVLSLDDNITLEINFAFQKAQ